VRAAFAFSVATALAAAPAFAQDDNTGGLYFGVGLADFSTGIDDIGDVDEATRFSAPASEPRSPSA
jgi:hypothetical protein